ncbi:hypothetical protein AB0M47_04155 [Hamadaea sp. NPDC051192]|uniref:hypothetical protein n=1 Tax=Hamadaea sp. NPDC051192 TaxID=3154940 RepID=UPI0034338BF2
MKHWSVSITARTPAPVTEDHAVPSGTALGPEAAIALPYEPAEVHACFDVEADTIDTVTIGLQRITQALNALGIEHTMEEAQAISYEALEHALTAPQVPPLVGIAEIAKILGVSRQRAHEVTGKPDFPKPVDELAAGKVYLRAAV